MEKIKNLLLNLFIWFTSLDEEHKSMVVLATFVLLVLGIHSPWVILVTLIFLKIIW